MLGKEADTHWSIIMTRYYWGQKWKSSKMLWKLPQVLLTENEQVLKAGVNGSFWLHSLRSTVFTHCCCRGEPTFSTNPLTRILQGPNSCSTSSVLNTLVMFPSPKWVYGNPVLQRNLSVDRKWKRDQASCSWKQLSPLCGIDICEITNGTHSSFMISILTSSTKSL